MDKRALGRSGVEVSAVGFGCMGISQGFGPAVDLDDGIAVIRAAVDRGITLFDTAEVLRSLRQRRGRRRGLGAVSRKVVIATKFGFVFDEQRSPKRRRSRASAHQARWSTVPESPRRRLRRPAVPAPRRPERADRGRRRHGEGTIERGQGSALRPLRSGCANDPPRARGPARNGAADGVLAVVARAGGADPSGARGTRHRLRAVQPARAWFSDRSGRPDDDVRSHRRPGRTFRASRQKPARRTWRSSTCSARSPPGTTPPLGKWRSPGCSPREPWIVPIPGTRRLDRLEENAAAAELTLTDDDLDELRTVASQIEVEGERYPEQMLRWIDR